MQAYLFPPTCDEDHYWQLFWQTDLGQLYQAIPWEELAALFPEKRFPQGKKPWLDKKGMIGLEMLKSYLGLSDAKLVERLNTDWAMRLFCGLCPLPVRWIRDHNLPSHYRKKLAQWVDYQKLQAVLAGYWRPYLQHPHLVLTDATCYESYIKYPTDVKLLWDSCQWVYQQIKRLCKVMQIPRPRSKFKDQHKKQTAYQKQRKKTKKQERKRIKALLYLLSKILGQLEELLLVYQNRVDADLPAKFFVRKHVIEKLYDQQTVHYHHPQDPIPDRIVSLFKPYLRPIVRGKENKRVEFGLKANIRQVDGINFIEHMSFDAFNEAPHLKTVIYQHQRDFGSCKQLGADQIFATNGNRKFCTQRSIATCFVPKGRIGKDEDQREVLRKIIANLRATVLEGSFGNEKNHYNLQRIKARTPSTEKWWCFIGMMTANAVKIAHRMEQPQLLKQSA